MPNERNALAKLAKTYGRAYVEASKDRPRPDRNAVEPPKRQHATTLAGPGAAPPRSRALTAIFRACASTHAPARRRLRPCPRAPRSRSLRSACRPDDPERPVAHEHLNLDISPPSDGRRAQQGAHAVGPRRGSAACSASRSAPRQRPREPKWRRGRPSPVHAVAPRRRLHLDW